MADKINKYLIIGGGVGAAVIIGVVFGLYSLDVAKPAETPIVEDLPQIISNYQSNDTLSVTSEYRINEQCEILFAMTASVYPNNEPLQPLSLLELVEKYPENFAQWSTEFQNENTTRAFLESGLSPEFLSSFTDVVMIEYSINPELKPTALLAFLPDPSTGDRLMELYENYDCEAYYNERQNILEP